MNVKAKKEETKDLFKAIGEKLLSVIGIGFKKSALEDEAAIASKKAMIESWKEEKRLAKEKRVQAMIEKHELENKTTLVIKNANYIGLVSREIVVNGLKCDVIDLNNDVINKAMAEMSTIEMTPENLKKINKDLKLINSFNDKKKENPNVELCAFNFQFMRGNGLVDIVTVSYVDSLINPPIIEEVVINNDYVIELPSKIEEFKNKFVEDILNECREMCATFVEWCKDYRELTNVRLQSIETKALELLDFNLDASLVIS